MEAIRELLTGPSRVLNKHAGKIYGFLPAIVINDKDTDDKQKRHLRGYLQVYFPTLQDQGSRDLIAPWARIVSASGGNCIDENKKKKVKIKITTWELKDKTVEVEEEEVKKKKVKKKRKVKKPKQVEHKRFKIEHTSFAVNSARLAGSARSVFQQVKAFLDKAPAGTKVLIHGHASTTGNKEYNQGLSERRAEAVRAGLLEAGLAQDQIGDVKGYGESRAGEIWSAEHGRWENNPADPNAEYDKRVRGDRGAPRECNPCRRVDMIIDYSAAEVEYEEKEEEYEEEVEERKKVKKKKKIKVPTPKEKEVEIEVPDPGPGPWGGGLYMPPQKGDEVLCGFEHGDMHRPYIVGALWNGQDKVPEPVTNAQVEGSRPEGCPATPSMKGDSLSGDGGKNDIQYMRSRTGNCMQLDDKNGVVRGGDRSGNGAIQLSNGKIEVLQGSKNISLYTAKKMRFDCKDFLVTAKKDIKLEAASDISTESGSNTTVNAQTAAATMHSGGNMTLTTPQKLSLSGQTGLAVTAKGGGLTMFSGGKFGVGADGENAEIKSDAAMTITAIGAGTFVGPSGLLVKASGLINCTAGPRMKLKGASVNLNSGGGAPGGVSFGSLLMGALRSVVGGAVSGMVAAGRAIAGAVTSPVGAAVIGGAIGGALLGPAGMVAGAAIGYRAAGGQLPPLPTPPRPTPGQAAVMGAVAGAALGPLGMAAGAAIGYRMAGGQLPPPPAPPTPSANQQRGMLGGALAGAAAGAIFGPVGMVGGAAMGLAGGLAAGTVADHLPPNVTRPPASAIAGGVMGAAVGAVAGPVGAVAGGMLGSAAGQMAGGVASQAGQIAGGVASQAGQIAGGAASQAGQIAGGAASQAGQIAGGVASQAGQIAGGAASQAGQIAGGLASQAPRVPLGEIQPPGAPQVPLGEIQPPEQVFGRRNNPARAPDATDERGNPRPQHIPRLTGMPGSGGGESEFLIA